MLILVCLSAGWETVDDLRGLDGDGGDSLDQVDDVAGGWGDRVRGPSR